MKALTFQALESIYYETVADPAILSPGDVIVQTTLSAICGSDLHIYHGRERGLDTGTVMGHEFVGRIVDSGREVKRFSRGDFIFSPFFSSCGSCFHCKNDLSCRCSAGQLFGWVENGRGLQGTQAEYVRVPFADTTLYPVPGDFSAEEALLLCDIFPTGFFCADMATGRSDYIYGVVGCGPVGLLAIVSLRELGAEKIIATDLVPGRLTIAERFGAMTVDGNSPSVVGEIRDLTEGRGVDAVLEVVGSLAAQKLSYEILRPGGILAVAGVHTAGQFAFSPVDLYNKNITYKTGRCPVQRYVPRLTKIIQQKQYDLLSVISHHLPLSQGPYGYRIFDQKLDGCTKVVLTADS